MGQASLTIPQDSLLDILKFQPESVLIQLFDNLLVKSDSSPLSDEEKIDIESSISEFNNGETILWKR